LATRWASEHAYLLKNNDLLAPYLFVRYEELVRDPISVVHAIADHLDLTRPPTMDPVVTAPSRSVKAGSALLDHGDTTRSYDRQLDAAAIDRATAVLERYDWPFYGPDQL